MTPSTQTRHSPAGSASVPDELAQAAETAAVLIERAIQDSAAPVETLARALARIAATASSASLGPELSACIESLQFYDRMVQQLTQIRDLLAGVARTRALEQRDWPALRERLRAHFTSESHRMLFNLLLPATGNGCESVRLHAHEGDVELF